MNNSKPTKEQVNKFNELYADVMILKEEVDLRIKDIRKIAKNVDKLADKAYRYANSKDGMYYEDKDGVLACASKSILNKVETLDFLRSYSFDCYNFIRK